ncbi:MAG: ATP-dependent sacrificial sulfur transferase LarE [Chloroflexi bacterium]|nr:ATP-dependent sacrificial sulfur transferase LarE [Chloroflexota bacterium]
MIHDEKYQSLRRKIAALESAIVAYSGGADSALLLRVARDVLGEHALGVIALSPSYAAGEREHARSFAAEQGLPILEITTDEMDNPNYVANAGDRCYYCKTELFDKLEQIRQQRGYAVIIDGFNADDVGDYRPGIRAAGEHYVVHPLQEAGLTKAEIRDISHELGLKTWDKPAMPCLSSRVPVGTPIRIGTLRQIEESEQSLHDLGFRQVRVRHHGKIARIEVDVQDLQRLIAPGVREQVVAAVQKAGYAYVAVDLAGYRMGNLNPVGATQASPTEQGSLPTLTVPSQGS